MSRNRGVTRSDEQTADSKRANVNGSWFLSISMPAHDPNRAIEIVDNLNSKHSSASNDDRSLDSILTDLEDRGLVGWDKKANRYDLHPMVRCAVWSTLDPSAKRNIYSELRGYFEGIARPGNWKTIGVLDDLTPTIELFNTLIGLEKTEEACDLFFEHIDLPTDYRLSASRVRIELLTPLVGSSISGSPRIEEPSQLLRTLNALGRSHVGVGELQSGLSYLESGITLSEQSPLLSGPDGECLYDLSHALRIAGCLRASEGTALRALARFGASAPWLPLFRCSLRLALTLAVCARDSDSKIILRRAQVAAQKFGIRAFQTFVHGVVAQCAIWRNELGLAANVANEAWTWAQSGPYERDAIRIERLLACATLISGSPAVAKEHLGHALARARAISLVEEELPARTALAELHREREEYATARELLDDVWAPAERGPYPLLHADARNVLAQLERDLDNLDPNRGHRNAAIEAATAAYRLAWCDGPPYAYYFGLTNARRHLHELGAPEPEIAPFDETKFLPLPEVELNPKDDYWVDPEKVVGC